MDHSDVSSPPLHSTSRRRRRWPLLVGLLLLFVAIIGGYFISAHLKAQSAWDAAVAEAEADDPHWRWENMQAQRRTWKDDENGALVMMAAKALLPNGWPAWDYPRPNTSPNLADAPPASEDEVAKASQADEERQILQDSFGELRPPYQLNQRQLAALREEMAKIEPALAEARRMAQLPGGRFPIKYSADFISTLLHEIQDARAVATLLSYDVLLRAQEQDLPGAFTSCQALLHLCRYFDEEPTLIAMLVRLAIRSIALRRLERVLAQGEPEEADLAKMQKLLEEEERCPILLWGVRGERAGSDQLASELENGNMTWAQLQGVAGGGGPAGTLLQGLSMLTPGGMRQQRAGLLTMNNRVVAAAQLPLEERKVADAKLNQELQAMPLLARLLLPAHMKVSQANDRVLAELRCVLALLASERFRRAEGRWPTNLAELTPKFLAQVPLDPFDGKPLRFRRLDDGIVVYSVSANGADDGGVKLSSNVQETGTDLGARLWDVPQRRQPPRALKPRQ